MYLVKTPAIVKWIFPSMVWDIPAKEKVIYLTFDDGPDIKVTPDILELLARFNAKASFFCVGEKVKQNLELFKKIIIQKHVVGNHTFHHLKGRKVSVKKYIEDINTAKQYIPSMLFRPPYGSITRKQIIELKKEYKLIMWSILTGDFDKKLSKEIVLQNSIKSTGKGSIIVFHDNAKFREKMLYALEGCLNHFSELGYNFEAIPVDDL